MKEVVADKAYISGDNLQTVVDHGASLTFHLRRTQRAKALRALEKLFHYYSFNAKNF